VRLSVALSDLCGSMVFLTTKLLKGYTKVHKDTQRTYALIQQSIRKYRPRIPYSV
jgi:hypothetical protein